MPPGPIHIQHLRLLSPDNTNTAGLERGELTHGCIVMKLMKSHMIYMENKWQNVSKQLTMVDGVTSHHSIMYGDHHNEMADQTDCINQGVTQKLHRL